MVQEMPSQDLLILNKKMKIQFRYEGEDSTEDSLFMLKRSCSNSESENAIWVNGRQSFATVNLTNLYIKKYSTSSILDCQDLEICQVVADFELKRFLILYNSDKDTRIAFMDETPSNCKSKPINLISKKIKRIVKMEPNRSLSSVVMICSPTEKMLNATILLLSISSDLAPIFSLEVSSEWGSPVGLEIDSQKEKEVFYAGFSNCIVSLEVIGDKTQIIEITNYIKLNIKGIYRCANSKAR